MNKKLNTHYKPENLSDRIAFAFTKLLRFTADFFFAKRYGHRAVVLETIAAVPGMVAGMLNHLKSLRRMEQDPGWIKILLDEAENERMHLMTFIHIAKPSTLERFIIIIAQGIFFNLYFMMYLISPIAMTYLLIKVSGVSMLENQIKHTKDGYEEYIKTTSAFIILPKKKL